VAEAIARDLDVTVLDFSSVMCGDLARELGSARLRVQCLDILEPPPSHLMGAFQIVAADRLINRMTQADCPRLFAHVAQLLRPGGVARLSVKLGWYEMDHRLLAEGRRRGTLDRFFDPAKRTIDYAAAATELASIEIAHGQIPRDVLLPWYIGRGCESRFEIADLERALAEARARGTALRLERMDDLPEADSSVLLGLRYD
jgi:hypothetical protein